MALLAKVSVTYIVITCRFQDGTNHANRHTLANDLSCRLHLSLNPIPQHYLAGRLHTLQEGTSCPQNIIAIRFHILKRHFISSEVENAIIYIS